MASHSTSPAQPRTLPSHNAIYSVGKDKSSRTHKQKCIVEKRTVNGLCVYQAQGGDGQRYIAVLDG